jgi:hypothetical protein
MIQPDKYQNALRSLNTILTRARWMAYEADAPELAELLDAAEILPKYIAQSEDATDVYRAAVESISQQFKLCSHAIHEFDDTQACVW